MKILEKVASLIAGEFNQVRVSLGNVQGISNLAMPRAEAETEFATQVSLGAYTKSTDIVTSHYTKTQANNLFSTQGALSSGLGDRYTKSESVSLFADKNNLANNYTNTTTLANNYATKVSLGAIGEQLVSLSASIFSVNHVSGDSMDLSGNLSIGGTFTAVGDARAQNVSALAQLSGMRAEFGDATSQANGTNIIDVKGGANIQGKLVVSSLDVKGTTNIVNTTSVEVSDNFIELNKAQDGSVTASEAGITINRGLVQDGVDGNGDPVMVEADDAKLHFNNITGKWSLTNDGSALAELSVGKIYSSNSFANLAGFPLATSFPGMVAIAIDTKINYISSGTAWVAIATQSNLDSSISDLGTFAEFQASFLGSIDTDGDGTTNANEDIDGDGILDGVDPNLTDGPLADADGDGVINSLDAFPNNPNETTDTDGDGVGDNADGDPDDASVSGDADNDGVDDLTDAFPNDASETTDTDGDGVGDNADAFPNDSSEDTDTDGDGVGDNSDTAPNDPTTTGVDSDGDGVDDGTDAFPNDPDEQLDTDGDGIGNNEDTHLHDPTRSGVDEDNDGVDDAIDTDSTDPLVTGIDTDGDGVDDVADDLPNDPTEQVDTDGDGVGDNSDADPDDASVSGIDTDGDGLDNVVDSAPNSPGTPTQSIQVDHIPGGPPYHENPWTLTGNENFYLSSETSATRNPTLNFVDQQNITFVGKPHGASYFTIWQKGNLGQRFAPWGNSYWMTAMIGGEWWSEILRVVTPNTSSQSGEPTSMTIKFDKNVEYMYTGNIFTPNIGGYINVTELDSDSDGVVNSADAFPNDPLEYQDSDGDGIGDNADPFPNQAETYSNGYSNLRVTKATGTDNITAFVFEKDGEDITYNVLPGKNYFMNTHLGTCVDAHNYKIWDTTQTGYLGDPSDPLLRFDRENLGERPLLRIIAMPYVNSPVEQWELIVEYTHA